MISTTDGTTPRPCAMFCALPLAVCSVETNVPAVRENDAMAICLHPPCHTNHRGGHTLHHAHRVTSGRGGVEPTGGRGQEQHRTGREPGCVLELEADAKQRDRLAALREAH